MRQLPRVRAARGSKLLFAQAGKRRLLLVFEPSSENGRPATRHELEAARLRVDWLGGGLLRWPPISGGSAGRPGRLV